MSYEEASREMDAQAARNGWTPNPNNSNARYAERPDMEIKRMAFESKQGYSRGNYSAKVNDHMKDCPNGMKSNSGRAL